MHEIQLSEVDPGCVMLGMHVKGESTLKLRMSVNTVLRQRLLVSCAAHNCLHSRSKACKHVSTHQRLKLEQPGGPKETRPRMMSVAGSLPPAACLRSTFQLGPASFLLSVAQHACMKCCCSRTWKNRHVPGMTLTWAVEEGAPRVAVARGRGLAGRAQLVGLDGQAPSIRLGGGVAHGRWQQGEGGIPQYGARAAFWIVTGDSPACSTAARPINSQSAY